MSKRIILVIVALGAVVLFSVGTAGYVALTYFDVPFAERQLPAAEARARELGIPLLASDIAPNPPVRPEENAGPILRRMCAAVAIPKATDMGKVDKKLRQGDPTEAKALLRSNQAALRLARAASLKPRVDMHRNWDQGVNVLFPEFAGYKKIGRMLSLDADLRASQGDTRGALDDLATIHRLSSLAAQENNLIATLIAIVLNTFRDHGAQRVAGHEASDAEALTKLRSLLVTDSDLPSLKSTFAGQEFIELATLRLFGGQHMSDRQIADQLLNGDLRWARKVRRAQPAMVTRHLQSWSRIWPAIASIPEDALRIRMAFATEEAYLARQRTMTSKISDELFGGPAEYSQAANAYITAIARDRATIALVDVLIYRAKHGALPTTLDQADIHAVDPFTGKSLLYRREGKGFRVYSVARDGHDNGGLTKAELPKDSDAPTDEAAIYPPLRK